MSLNKLALFKNVKITPDYSVVHDMDIETWKNYLMGWLDPMPADSDTPELVHTQTVNYYRMPEVIRIEGNYDAIRKATYGFLEDGRHEGNETLRTSFKLLFFWVKDVRLLKQSANVDNTDPSDPLWKDVCELDVELDVWSTYAGCFELYDSYIERRHMPRWKNEGTELVPDWKPIYYPNAAQGVEGAYEKEAKEDATKKKTFTHLGDVDIGWIVLSGINASGVAFVCLSLAGRDSSNNHLDVFYQDGANFRKYFWYPDIISGNVYTLIGRTANFVQSINVVPDMWGLIGFVNEVNDNGTWRLKFNHPAAVYGANGAYLPLTALYMIGTEEYTEVNVIAPDHSAQPIDGEYLDEHEPMMYMSPARKRKVVTSFGDEIYEIPDIAAFQKRINIKNVYDLNGIKLFVYSGPDYNIADANILGCVGVVDAPSLPIYTSAWKEYAAISAVSDNIAYNAKQMQSFANGMTGIASSAMIGAATGQPVVGLAGVISSVVGGGASMKANEEELRAKRVQIMNSPCNLKSTGSGLGAVMSWLFDILYVTMKLDDVSMEKLRFMYYWYGYHVNRTFKGIIDLETREVFDFIKTNGAKVKGDLTAGAAKQVEAIFDRGVTIYHGSAGYALIGTGDMVENDEV